MREKKAKPVVQPQPSQGEQEINAAAIEIEEVLKKYRLGMHAVIQIFKLPTESPIIAAGHTNGASPIILPGQDGDLPPGIIEALRPIGDEIGRA